MGKVTQVSNLSTGLTARNAWNEAMKTVESDTTLTGLGTTSSPLSVASVATGISIINIDAGDSPYNVTGTEDIISCDTSSGSISINFTSAATFTGFPYIHNVDGGVNLVTINPDGTETIAGNSSIELSEGESIRVYSDTTNLQYV